MVNTLKRFLVRLGIFREEAIILAIVAGVIAVILFALILIIFLKRRKFKNDVNVNHTDDKEAGDKRAEDSYESIAKQIKQVEKKHKSILFTSTEPGALPVTIPVNVAIELAKNEKRCLLIDLDLRRDAIAKVFGIAPDKVGLRVKAVQTEFENLWVWPGHNFSQSKQMNITGIVKMALDKKSPDKFDFIVINAPSLISSPDRKQIISAAQAAFICTNNTSSEMKKLTELMKPLNCTVIDHIKIP